MDLLVFKFTVTPAAIALATAVGRRWGPALGGWIAGIPFTSTPVILFVTLDHGTSFGSLTASGVLAGTASQAAFALAYSVVALRVRWWGALLAAVAAFAATTVGLDKLQPPPVSGLEITAGAILLALALMPRSRPVELEAEARLMPASLDVPLRAIVATVFVVVLTALAQHLGPVLAGLLSPFPLFGAVLIVFPYRLQGRAAALGACRGFLWGLFATMGFAFLLSELLPNLGLAGAMVIALVVALAIQAVTLAIVRSGARRAGAPATTASATRE
ncbi:MAG: hypothetical protein JOY80_00065 [Candidatus Dormibacteraeota bacterium]|nr:hypothetical protein [Candidatus Dormibacteraeota bacterium]